MQIYGPFRLSASQNAGGAQRSSAQAPQQLTAQKASAPVDQLDLSSAASGVNRLEGTSPGSGEIRIDKVADLRRQIASGSYDTPEKMEAAFDRMLDQFA
ncbi:hypothetical protein Q31b_20980 [Novipirellula aureliae]|uniref:Anti-sigma-28 factor FlgM C-terminal domain-containing protein n=1 Tax=Novipirellula aureliae TaxID=2527966 RepID=A0A5C6E609_9BACT|nr:flagellar biosynthesis anti-sigma factor FlgM [Novipirellula aureliae]TWU43061.1 hypothetical protein Q31b_20980 [Novipirellula aureliae]